MNRLNSRVARLERDIAPDDPQGWKLENLTHDMSLVRNWLEEQGLETAREAVTRGLKGPEGLRMADSLATMARAEAEVEEYHRQRGMPERVASVRRTPGV